MRLAAYLVTRVCFPQPHHRQLSTHGLPTARWSAEQHAFIGVVQGVERLSLNWVEMGKAAAVESLILLPAECSERQRVKVQQLSVWWAASWQCQPCKRQLQRIFCLQAGGGGVKGRGEEVEEEGAPEGTQSVCVACVPESSSAQQQHPAESIAAVVSDTAHSAQIRQTTTRENNSNNNNNNTTRA